MCYKVSIKHERNEILKKHKNEINKAIFDSWKILLFIMLFVSFFFFFRIAHEQYI